MPGSIERRLAALEARLSPPEPSREPSPVLLKAVEAWLAEFENAEQRNRELLEAQRPVSEALTPGENDEPPVPRPNPEPPRPPKIQEPRRIDLGVCSGLLSWSKPPDQIHTNNLYHPYEEKP